MIRPAVIFFLPGCARHKVRARTTVSKRRGSHAEAEAIAPFLCGVLAPTYRASAMWHVRYAHFV